MDNRFRARLEGRLAALKLLGAGIPVRTPARGCVLSTAVFLDRVSGIERRLRFARTARELVVIARETDALEGQARNVPVRYAHPRTGPPPVAPATPPKRVFGLMRLKSWKVRYEPWTLVWEQTPDGVGSYRVTNAYLKSTCLFEPGDHLVPEECYPHLGEDPNQPVYGDPTVTYDNLATGDAILDHFNTAKVWAKRGFWNGTWPLSGVVNPHRWYTGNNIGAAQQCCPGDPFLGGPWGHTPRHYYADTDLMLNEPGQYVMDDQAVQIGHVDLIHKFAINPADYPDDTHVKLTVRVVENGSGYFPGMAWLITGGYTTAEIYSDNEWHTFGGLLNGVIGGPTGVGDDPGAWYACTDKAILSPSDPVGTMIIEKPAEIIYVGFSLSASMSQPPGHPDIYSIQHWYGGRVTDPEDDWTAGYRGHDGLGAWFQFTRPGWYPWDAEYPGSTLTTDACLAESAESPVIWRADGEMSTLASLSELEATLETTVEGYTP